MRAVSREQKRGRGRPQTRSDEDTLHVIFQAARHEFLLSGYAATGMETLATRAGVSTKTLYRLVPNKAALFERMVADRLDRFFAVIASEPAPSKNLTTALTDILVECAIFSLDAEVIGFNRVVIAECGRFPEIARAFYLGGIQRVPVALATWLGQQKIAGLLDLNNPDVAAEMLIGMMISEPQRAAVLKQRPPMEAPAIRKRAAECVRLFLDGCRK